VYIYIYTLEVETRQREQLYKKAEPHARENAKNSCYKVASHTGNSSTVQAETRTGTEVMFLRRCNPYHTTWKSDNKSYPAQSSWQNGPSTLLQIKRTARHCKCRQCILQSIPLHQKKCPVAPSFQHSDEPGPSKEEIVNKCVAERPCATTHLLRSANPPHPTRRPEGHSVKRRNEHLEREPCQHLMRMVMRLTMIRIDGG